MTYEQVIEALDKIKKAYEDDVAKYPEYGIEASAKGGYYRVGNVAIKIAEIQEVV